MCSILTFRIVLLQLYWIWNGTLWKSYPELTALVSKHSTKHRLKKILGPFLMYGIVFGSVSLSRRSVKHYHLKIFYFITIAKKMTLFSCSVSYLIVGSSACYYYFGFYSSSVFTCSSSLPSYSLLYFVFVYLNLADDHLTLLLASWNSGATI